MSVTYRHSVVVVLVALIGSGVAGCGSGDSGAKELARQDQLRQARADAARTARQDERLKELERRLREQKKTATTGSGSSGSSGSTPSAPSGGATSGPVSCGSGLTAGSHTSCAFAQNVRDAYDGSSGGDTTVVASSPVTGKTYSMRCSGGSPHACIGGNSASVYFP